MNNFLPDIGTLTTYRRPQGPGVRVDDGFEEGMAVPIYYDPMISKLVAHGKDRTEAIKRLTRAIDEYRISGLSTTLSFCRFAINHEAFTSGNFDTHFVNDHFKPEMLSIPNEDEKKIAALLVTSHNMSANSAASSNNGISKGQSAWITNRRGN
jgi:acetyl/propionyl-CoA carboxylase alpha subunit